jgi:hypothetical protein
MVAQAASPIKEGHIWEANHNLSTEGYSGGINYFSEISNKNNTPSLYPEFVELVYEPSHCTKFTHVIL